MKNRKELFALSFALVAAMLLSACDPSCTEELVVKNMSGHDVVVTRYHTVHSGPWNDWQPIEDSVRTDVETLKDGDETKSIEADLGTTGRVKIEYTMSYLYWHDSVRIEFDDGTTRVFRPDCDTVWGPYAFGSDSYTYEDKPNEGRAFHGEILWARLTYTIKTADYEACLSR